MADNRTLRERLEDYKYIDGEIKSLLRKRQDTINGSCESDFVFGSQTDYPYIKRKFAVEGLPDGAKADVSHIDDAIREKREEKAELEKIVESIPDIRTRQIIRYRYIFGDSVADTAAAMGYSVSTDGVKKTTRNFFKMWHQKHQKHRRA